MKRSAAQTRLLLLIGITLLVGFLSTLFFLRLDFTGDKRYTLSAATLNILKDIKEPVTVTAYFSKDLPPFVESTKTDFTDLLVEYANRSGGNVLYTFVDPTAEPQTEQEILQKGIQPVMIDVREKDQNKKQKAYLGAIITMGSQTDVLPIVQPGTAMEYALSSSIKKLTMQEKQKIAFLSGHREPSLEQMPQVRSSLSVLYDVSPYTISDTAPIPNTFKAVVIIAPQDSFSPMQLQRLSEYMSNGGNVLAAASRVGADFSSSASGHPVTTGLEKWLEQMGISVEEKFIMQAECGVINVQYSGNSFFTNQIPFPYFPRITHFADHPISKGLENVQLTLSSPITYAFPDTSTKVVVLAQTSEHTNTAPANTFFDVNRQYTMEDFPLSALPVAIAVEGKVTAGKKSKMVVFGNGEFAINGEGQNMRRLDPDQVSLMVNAIDWLSDESGLNELRTKAVASRPIKKELTDNERATIKYSNFLAPIFLVMIYGVVRMQLRRRRRMKWMEERYV